MDTCVTAENIEEVKRRIAYLETEFKIRCQPEVKIGVQIFVLFFDVPASPMSIHLSTLLQYTEGVESLQVVDDSTVRTPLIRQTAIDYISNGFSDNIQFLETFFGNNFTVKVVDRPFLIGFVNNTEFTDDRVHPCLNLYAVEFKYATPEAVLTPEEEDVIIRQVLFHTSDNYNRVFSVGKRDPRKYRYTVRLELQKPKHIFGPIKIESLPHYTPMMDLYADAIQIKNDEIQFLYFYKLIEYISPAVAKANVHEKLKQRLGAESPERIDDEYVESILKVVRTHDKSIKDSELSKTVMEQCDIEKLYGHLPIWVQKKCPRGTKTKPQINGAISEERQTAIRKKIAAILYATRNNIVHAKSNYDLTGDECPKEDLPQLNIFMRQFCKSLIDWKEQHPEIELK